MLGLSKVEILLIILAILLTFLNFNYSFGTDFRAGENFLFPDTLIIDDDLIIAGGTIKSDATIIGDVISGSNRLVQNGVVEGSIIAGAKDIDIVAVNDLTDASTLAYLLKYDSNFGILENDIKAEGDSLVIDGKKVRVCSEKDPSKLPWGELGVEIVVESTGIFRDAETAGAHLTAGAKKVIISAPAKGD